MGKPLRDWKVVCHWKEHKDRRGLKISATTDTHTGLSRAEAYEIYAIYERHPLLEKGEMRRE